MQVSLAPKIILPFVLAVIVITACLGVTCCALMSDSLNKGLLKKSKIMNDNLLGVLADPFSMGEWTRVQTILDTAQSADADVKYVILIASDGNVLASTDKKFQSGTTVSQAVVDSMKTDKYRVRQTKNREVFEILAPISAEASQKAFLRIGISRHDMDSVLQETQTRVLLIGFVGLVGGVLFYLLTIHGVILAPLGVVADMARRLAKGQLIEPAPIANNDEIGDLSQSMKELIHYFGDMSHVAEEIASGNLFVQVEARSEFDAFGNAFHQMVESLQEITTKLSLSADRLERTASELAVSSTQQSHLISQQHSAVTGWVLTLDDIRGTVNDTSARAGSVLDISKHSLEVSSKGISALEQANNAMMMIRDHVNQINSRIAELTNNAIQIGEMTGFVEEIAEMSEILTINGAIEAVRAGEAGRGFHVIAKEVKKLSLQSKAATSDVRKMLGLIQDSTAVAFKVVDEGNERVQVGVREINEVGSTFRTLYQTIVSALDAANAIAAATKSQVDQIEQMTDAMKTIANAAGESAIASKQQNETAQNLRDLAVTINGIVQHYRLKDDADLHEDFTPPYPGAMSPLSDQVGTPPSI